MPEHKALDERPMIGERPAKMRGARVRISSPDRCGA